MPGTPYEQTLKNGKEKIGGNSKGANISKNYNGDKIVNDDIKSNDDKLNNAFRANRINDYENIYKPDKYGEEMGPEARVWHVYLDESEIYDKEMIEGYQGSANVLLIFAGLFATVATGFLSLSVPALSPDYNQLSFTLLAELVVIQRTMANGSTVNNIPDPSPASLISKASRPSAQTVWINGLIIMSLVLSLASALIAVLVQQWITSYSSNLRGTPRNRVTIHHLRFLGMETYGVRVIIGTVPYLLHTALLLFLVGLSLFLQQLNRTLFGIITAVTTLLYIAYFVSHLLPIRYPNCPYKTQASEYLYWILTSILPTSPLPRVNTDLEVAQSNYPESLREAESQFAKKNADVILASALVWLLSEASNPSVAPIVARAPAGLPSSVPHRALEVLKGGKRIRLPGDKKSLEASPFVANIFNNMRYESNTMESRYSRTHIPYDQLGNVEMLLRSLYCLQVDQFSIYYGTPNRLYGEIVHHWSKYDLSANISGLSPNLGSSLSLLPMICDKFDDEYEVEITNFQWQMLHSRTKFLPSTWLYLLTALTSNLLDFLPEDDLSCRPVVLAMLFTCCHSNATRIQDDFDQNDLRWDEAPISFGVACKDSAQLSRLGFNYLNRCLAKQGFNTKRSVTSANASRDLQEIHDTLHSLINYCSKKMHSPLYPLLRALFSRKRSLHDYGRAAEALTADLIARCTIRGNSRDPCLAIPETLQISSLVDGQTVFERYMSSYYIISDLLREVVIRDDSQVTAIAEYVATTLEYLSIYKPSEVQFRQSSQYHGFLRMVETIRPLCKAGHQIPLVFGMLRNGRCWNRLMDFLDRVIGHYKRGDGIGHYQSGDGDLFDAGQLQSFFDTHPVLDGFMHSWKTYIEWIQENQTRLKDSAPPSDQRAHLNYLFSAEVLLSLIKLETSISLYHPRNVLVGIELIKPVLPLTHELVQSEEWLQSVSQKHTQNEDFRDLIRNTRQRFDHLEDEAKTDTCNQDTIKRFKELCSLLRIPDEEVETTPPVMDASK